MALYCMCRQVLGTKKNLDNYSIGSSPAHGGVVLKKRMDVMRIGAEQFIEDKESGSVYRHYPNVDLYSCPNCGTVIAREG